MSHGDEWFNLTDRYPALFALLDAVDLRLTPRVCADRLGLSSTAQLERDLRTKGLPKFRILRDWYYVARIHEAASIAASLSSVASQRGDYPSVLYRFVRRVAGRDWRELAQLDTQTIRAIVVAVWRAHGARRSHRFGLKAQVLNGIAHAGTPSKDLSHFPNEY